MTVVNTNISASVAQANLKTNQKAMDQAIERLSSGLRINSASDDAAGMAIVNKMDSTIRGLTQAVRNAEDGQNLIDTAEGAQVEVINLLQRLRELAVQSSNDTNTALDRSYVDDEADQLLNEINRISNQTRWNGTKLLDGTFDAVQFQIGAQRGEDVTFSVRSSNASKIGNHRVEGKASHIAGAADSIDAHTISVSGFIGTKAVSVAANASAKTAAASINANTELTGVSATAVSKMEISSVFDTGNIGFTIGDGSSSAAITTTNISDVSDLTALRDAINDKSGTSGVTAAVVNNDTSKLILTHSTGEDIQISSVSAGDFFIRSLDATEASTNSMSSTDTTQGITVGDAAADTVSMSASAGVASGATAILTSQATTNVGGFVKVAATGHASIAATITLIGTNFDDESITEAFTIAGGGAVVTNSASATTGSSVNQYKTLTSATVTGAQMTGVGIGRMAADSSSGAQVVGQLQFDSERTYSVTASAGTNASDNFTGGGTTATAATFSNVGAIDLSTVANSENAISVIDGAISMVNISRAEMGAISNRLDSTIGNLTNIIVNTEASKSHVNDANFAKESSNLTKHQILSQAATSMLAQANASKQTVLALLQG
jgi:flagellin